MAAVRLAYVESFKDRHGRMRSYYRRGGDRIPLPGVPGSAEFLTAYQVAAAAFARVEPHRSAVLAADSMDALCIAYYRSPAFLQLRSSTQATYRGIIDRFRLERGPKGLEHGKKRVAQLEKRHVQDIVATKLTASGPWAANNLLSLLKMLMRFAVEYDWRKDDPTIGVRPIRARTDGFVTWSEEDIAAFEKKWPIGARERLALALLLYTGQRRGDVVRMGRQHLSGDTIRVVQNKTGASLVIPLHPRLREVVDATPSDNLAFLTTAWRRPFSAAGFGNWFREACDGAGLKGRSAHGLRKAAARRLAEAGASANQIAAVTGHRTLREVSRYTAAASQEQMARDAMERIGGD